MKLIEPTPERTAAAEGRLSRWGPKLYTNPECLAERGERHDADYTSDPMPSVWDDPRDWS